MFTSNITDARTVYTALTAVKWQSSSRHTDSDKHPIGSEKTNRHCRWFFPHFFHAYRLLTVLNIQIRQRLWHTKTRMPLAWHPWSTLDYRFEVQIAAKFIQIRYQLLSLAMGDAFPRQPTTVGLVRGKSSAADAAAASGVPPSRDLLRIH